MQPNAWIWGERGHTLCGEAAALTLPAAMPGFFRKAADQLGYLTAEPDRWRDRNAPAVTNAFNPDHAINLELVPSGALLARDRFAYLSLLQQKGLGVTVGMAPCRTLELFERLCSEFRLWRKTTDPQVRGWIEQRILNDAGILGHYVTDGSQPLHTSIHHHGWVGSNPSEYTTDSSIHARFEGKYVDAHIALADLTFAMPAVPHVLTAVQPQIVVYFETTHQQLVPLFELEKRAAFNRDTTAQDHKDFVVARLTAGATMLRDLWWTAWVTSAEPVASPEASPATPGTASTSTPHVR